MAAEINRREFVAGLSAVCAGLCLGCGLADAQSTTATSGGTIAVGNIKDYAKGSISDKYAGSAGLLIACQDDQIYAMTNLCSHRNAALNVVDGKTIKCFKHGSVFSEHGTVLNPPAKRSLMRFAISKDADGNLTVDKTQSFGEKDWEKPAAFVKLS